MLVGEKGSLVIPHVAMPKLFPEEKFPAGVLPVIEGVDHYTQWADACLGEGKTTSHFDYAGPLTETVLLGTIGIRFPEARVRLGRKGSQNHQPRARLNSGSPSLIEKAGSQRGSELIPSPVEHIVAKTSL